MDDKLIIGWLHRVLSEKCQDIKKLQERISVLNHQVQHFSAMDKRYQKQVIESLIKDLEEYDWNDAIKQLK